MEWKNLYKQKMVSAKFAVSNIQMNDRVVVMHAAGEPQALIKAMVEGKHQYKNVEIIHMIPLGSAPYCEQEFAPYFTHHSLFAGSATRKAIEEGRAEFTPVYFSEIPELLRTTLHPTVALIQVSPPDEHGYCSLGVSVDYTKAAADCADLVIAQVNKYMPRTLGDSMIHVSELHYIVQEDEPLFELQPANIKEIERSIGKLVASLIQDGDCLQLGIGALPDAVLKFLTDKKDLGIHSEMFSDGVVDLINAGVINNQKKTLHKGKSIATFLMGTRKLYDYVNNNPAVELYPVDYVNDPVVIAQNDHLISINSCVQIDLMGQVVSDTVGLKQLSGVGGQVDFVRGAKMSRGGKTIMAMPSTTANGTISKIVSFIDEGACVTTSRYDVDYVVTEFGIAQLKGKTLRQRAKALIHIAHPNFKEDLEKDYEKRFHDTYYA